VPLGSRFAERAIVNGRRESLNEGRGITTLFSRADTVHDFDFHDLKFS
jgi:hypothetical protein